MKNYAHIETVDGKKMYQTVGEHCRAVAEIMGEHCKGLGMYHLGYLTGLLHDMGMCTRAFQNYLLSGDDKKRGRIDHSTAAAKYIFVGQEATCAGDCDAKEIIGMVIMSHHSTLQNFFGPDYSSDYIRRLDNKDLPGYDECVANYFDPVNGVATREEIAELFVSAGKECQALYDRYVEMKTKKDCDTEERYYTGMSMKILHGYLIDADWLDSANWMTGGAKAYGKRPNWEQMNNNLMLKYQSFGQPQNAVEQGRADIAEQCAAFATKAPGIYRLSVPTGAGKTLSVLRFALPHAQKHGMRHIIEVVPYTSIIEQNAKDVREAVQQGDEEEYVYEHHCNMDMALDKKGNFTAASFKRKAVTERWDAPIIFTTQVRLLSMLFGGKKGDFRRLNALHDSILIFDEIQTLPTRCIYMFNLAMNFLCRVCNCTIILSTATQPQLETLEYPILDDGEMVSNLDDMFDVFRRVHIHYDPTPKNKETIGRELYARAKADGNALYIANTTSAAREIAKEVVADKAKDGNNEMKVVYLSTKLCPKHRTEVVKKMKADLKAGKKMVCVSTQLIEAGVNISFRNTFRSMASLASVAHAAGCCNRNGEEEYGNVYIVNPNAFENTTMLFDIHTDKTVLAETISSRYKQGDNLDDILDPQCISDFFRRHYRRIGDVRPCYLTDKGDLFDLLSQDTNYCCSKSILNRQAFRTASEEFEAISNDTVPVLVPYGHGKELIEMAKTLNPETCSSLDYIRFTREAQLYAVNLGKNEQKKLLSSGQMRKTISGVYALTGEMGYDTMYGEVLTLQNEP